MAIRVRGMTIEINADTTGLADAFKNVSSELKGTSNYLKDIEYYLKNIKGDKTALLEEKWKSLNTRLDETKQKLEIEKEALAELSKSDSTDKVKAEQEALQRQIVLDEAEVKRLEESMKDFGSVAKQQALDAAKKWEDLGDKIKGVGDKLASAGKTMTRKVTVPIVAAGTASVTAAIDYESSLAKVASVTDRNVPGFEESWEALEEQILSLSGTSKYSATEVSDAVYYMSLAGWDLNESMAALPEVLALATAGEMDLGRASDIVTDYFTAFGEGAGSVEHMVDVMSATMVSSNTDVDQLGEAFKYVAPVAGQLGFSVDAVSLALGIMANNGIKGSQAGTTLRMMMQRLVNPTQQQAAALEALGFELQDGMVVVDDFDEVMDVLRSGFEMSGEQAEEYTKQLAILDSQLEEGSITEDEYADAVYNLTKDTAGLEAAERSKNLAIAFGVRAMSGAAAIAGTTEKDYTDLASAIGDCEGKTQEISDLMLNTTQGSFLKLQHSVQNLGIAFGQTMMPTVQKVIDKLQGLIDWLASLDEGTRETIITVAAIVAAIGPVLTTIGTLISSVGSIISLIGKAKAVIATLNLSFTALNPTILIIVGAIAAVIAIGALLITHWDEISAWAKNLWENIKATFEDIKEAIAGAWDSVLEKGKEIWDNITTAVSDAVDTVVSAVKEKWEDAKETITNTWNNIKDTAVTAWTNITSALSEKWETIKAKVSETWNNVKSTISTTWTNIKSSVSTAAETVKTNMSNAWSVLKSSTVSAWGNIKQKIADNGGGIKGTITTLAQSYIATWKGAFNTIDAVTGGKLSSALSKVKDKLSSIKQAFTDKLDAAKDVVAGIIEKIKGLFNFTWSLPSLKLPHVSISGSFSLKPPSVPSFSISWYKKAYQDPVLFTSPTVLPTANGYKGFGDGSGAEIVIGMNKLQELVGQTGNVTNNITIVQQPGQSAAQLAQMVAERINREVYQRKAVYG